MAAMGYADTVPGTIYATQCHLATKPLDELVQLPHELVEPPLPRALIVWRAAQVPSQRDPQTNLPHVMMLVSWTDNTHSPLAEPFEIMFTATASHWQAVDRPALTGQLVNAIGRYVAHDPVRYPISMVAHMAAERLATRRAQRNHIRRPE